MWNCRYIVVNKDTSIYGPCKQMNHGDVPWYIDCPQQSKKRANARRSKVRNVEWPPPTINPSHSCPLESLLFFRFSRAIFKKRLRNGSKPIKTSVRNDLKPDQDPMWNPWPTLQKHRVLRIWVRKVLIHVPPMMMHPTLRRVTEKRSASVAVSYYDGEDQDDEFLSDPDSLDVYGFDESDSRISVRVKRHKRRVLEQTSNGGGKSTFYDVELPINGIAVWYRTTPSIWTRYVIRVSHKRCIGIWTWMSIWFCTGIVVYCQTLPFSNVAIYRLFVITCLQQRVENMAQEHTGWSAIGRLVAESYVFYNKFSIQKGWY